MFFCSGFVQRFRQKQIGDPPAFVNADYNIMVCRTSLSLSSSLFLASVVSAFPSFVTAGDISMDDAEEDSDCPSPLSRSSGCS
jgi:hypothetical protein